MPLLASDSNSGVLSANVNTETQNRDQDFHKIFILGQSSEALLGLVFARYRPLAYIERTFLHQKRLHPFLQRKRQLCSSAFRRLIFQLLPKKVVTIHPLGQNRCENAPLRVRQKPPPPNRLFVLGDMICTPFHQGHPKNAQHRGQRPCQEGMPCI
ncbi:MAG: hypothetical protein E7049_07650 [Lentisphaerae bacterium]|nr:hypothetical protein [Lentisphaerota bacterium]